MVVIPSRLLKAGGARAGRDIGLGIITGCSERQSLVVGVVAVRRQLRGSGPCHGFFLQLEICMRIDLRRLDGLMAEP